MIKSQSLCYEAINNGPIYGRLCVIIVVSHDRRWN